MASNLAVQLTDSEVELSERCSLLAKRVFDLYGWEWGWSDVHIPTAEEIAATIQSLIRRLKENDGRGPVSSGRLRIDNVAGKLDVSLNLGLMFKNGDIWCDEPNRGV